MFQSDKVCFIYALRVISIIFPMKSIDNFNSCALIVNETYICVFKYYCYIDN